MIFDNLIQPVKYKKGMRMGDLMRKSCEYLGVTFSSTLYDSGGSNYSDVLIPRKTALASNTTIAQSLFGIKTITHKDNDDNNNPSSVGYPEWSFADLILAEEQRLNAEIKIINNVVHFETKDHWQKYSSYTLPNIKPGGHGTNACELSAAYLLSYSIDSQDTNTSDQYTGTSCQMQLSPNVIQNYKNVLLKNITEITLRYALAKRKESLNGIEEVFNVIYDIVADVYNSIVDFFNTVIGAINDVLQAIDFLLPGNQSGLQIDPIAPFPPNPILARIGAMLLSSDFIGIEKILVIDSSNKLHSNNVNLTAARTLIDTFHFTNFAIRKTTTNGAAALYHNQWLTYADKETPFCCDDYLKVLNNNYIKTYDQKDAIIKSLVWNPYKGMAKITYRVKEQYTKNLNQKYIIDGKP